MKLCSQTIVVILPKSSSICDAFIGPSARSQELTLPTNREADKAHEYLSANRPLGNYDAVKLFEHLSESAWCWLGDARRLGLGCSEDTVSDLTMLEISRRGLRGVDVIRVSKRKERKVGFDWLWVINRPGGSPMAYVVQAKKMKLDQSSTYSYGRLKYRAGTRYQIDALESCADRLGAVPLYCFYNNVDYQTARTHWNCRVKKRSQARQADLRQLGCTLVPSHVVRPVHDARTGKNFYSLHCSSEALPWRCLFHPRCSSSGLVEGSSQLSVAHDSSGAERVQELVSSLATERETQVDREELVRFLELDDLVDRYVTGTFIPAPDRILSLNFED